MAGYNHEANLGYWDDFMRQYGKADQATRDELYRDCLAYIGGAETGAQLVAQTYQLLAVAPPSPQMYVGGKRVSVPPV